MARVFDVNRALCSFAFDLQRRAHDSIDEKELLTWCRTRLTRIKWEREQSLKFNSKEYVRKHG